MPAHTRLAHTIEDMLGIPSIAGWDDWNSFTETILRIDRFLDDDDCVGFSRENIAAFTATTPGDYYYPIGQVFEPDVLREVCDLQGVDIEDVLRLRGDRSERAAALRDRVDQAAETSDAELIVLISALVTLSRFELAAELLDGSGDRSPRFVFEAAMLRYIIGNRVRGRALGTEVMATVRATAQHPDIPPHRVLDACTTAVVWYLKGGGVDKEDFAWFARRGDGLIVDADETLPASAVSAWYRGVAMIPAELGDIGRTRALMERAAEAAETAIADDDGPFAENLHKTYLESSVKEHMYVSRDEVAALQAATTLVSWDPLWSVSSGEHADVLAAFGHAERAAQAYDHAVSLGAPYVAHHLRNAAQQYVKAGQCEAAIARYLVLSALLPDPSEALEATDRLIDTAAPNPTIEAARRRFDQGRPR